MKIFLCSFSFLFFFSAFSQPLKKWDNTIGGSDHDQIEFIEETSDAGFILGGWSASPVSSDVTQTNRGGFDYWIVKTDPNGVVLWDARFGGSSDDRLMSLQQTDDGGYILGGYSNSQKGGDKTDTAYIGSYDYWIVKTDANGVKEWDNVFGGIGNDRLYSIIQTDDGGYLMGGESKSSVGGNKTTLSYGDYDYWVIKTDANGIKQWEKIYGGQQADHLKCIKKTTDGGYILGGYSRSPMNPPVKTEDAFDISGALSYDYWVIKIKSDGTEEWDKIYGGSGDEIFASLQQTKDGGYVLAGQSRSWFTGGNISEFTHGKYDYWIVKTDGSGNKIWDKQFGGIDNEEMEKANSIIQLCDGGYIAVGDTYSQLTGNKTKPNTNPASLYSENLWMIRLDASGNKQWERIIGSLNDKGHDEEAQVLFTSDGGFLVAGTFLSDAGYDKTENSVGSYDWWIMKLGGGELIDASFVTSSACFGDSSTFINSTTINFGAVDEWKWSFGDPASGNENGSSEREPSHLYSVAGTYTVELVAGYNCRYDTAYEVVNVNIKPVADLGNDTLMCIDSLPVLNAFNPLSSYVWSTGAISSSITVQQSGIYSVTVTNVYDCRDIDEAVVTIENCSPTSLYIPNSFTPNNDGNNDVFYCYGNKIKEFEWYVFNRWGELVFKSNDLMRGWDGIYQNNLSEEDVYPFMIYYMAGESTVKQTYSGTITLIR